MSLRNRKNSNKKSKRLFGGASGNRLTLPILGSDGRTLKGTERQAAIEERVAGGVEVAPINCPSDHLPMLYKVNIGGDPNFSVTVLQMNLLAQGLAEDGFLGGSAPKSGTGKSTGIPETTADLLKESKKKFKEFYETDGQLKGADKNRAKTFAKSDTYEKMQEALGVNPKGPWGKLVADTVEHSERVTYMNKLISETQPDIVCFQEDDFSWEFMPGKYTCFGDLDYVKAARSAEGTFTFPNEFEAPKGKTINKDESINKGLKDFYDKNKPEYKTGTDKVVIKQGETVKIANKPARFAKQNSNCRNIGAQPDGGKGDDGTTIWWNPSKVTAEDINLFQISKKDDTDISKVKTEGAVHVKFLIGSEKSPSHLHVISTHLSSGRDKNSAREKEVNKILDYINGTCSCTGPVVTDDEALLIAGDFNEHPVFPLLTGRDKCSPSSIGLKFEGYQWWDGVTNCADFEAFQKSSATNVSVFKIRGPGTNQPLKANEYEHQLIDWNFGRNIKFAPAVTDKLKLNNLRNLRNLVFPNHKESKDGFGSQGCIIKRTPVNNSEDYDSVSTNSDFQQMLLPNRIDIEGLPFPSDGVGGAAATEPDEGGPSAPTEAPAAAATRTGRTEGRTYAAAVTGTAANSFGGGARRSRRRRQKRSTKRRRRQRQRARRVTRRRQRQSNKRQRRR